MTYVFKIAKDAAPFIITETVDHNNNKYNSVHAQEHRVEREDKCLYGCELLSCRTLEIWAFPPINVKYLPTYLNI